MDNETWQRARGWALWKSLITIADQRETDNLTAARHLKIIKEILNKHKNNKLMQ